MKKTLILLFLAISTIGYSQQLEWIPFNWESGIIGRKLVEKVAITIPVTIDTLPHKFNMQLDLGAVNTVFYGNSIKPYLEKYPYLKSKIDSTKTFFIQSKENVKLNDVDLYLGTIAFNIIDVGLFDKYGKKISKRSINSKKEHHIGTIAPDLFQDKILIIDYKQQRLAVAETLPVEYTDAAFEKFEIKNGRIKIPFAINEKEELLMFDTGSSIFSLVTTKENALKVGSADVEKTMTVSSWGEKVTFYGLKTVIPIYFGKKELVNSLVYYNDKGTFDYFFESENIWGLTGNAYFLENIIIINYKDNLFGIK